MKKKIFGIVGIILLIVLIIICCSIKPDKDNESYAGEEIITNATAEALKVKEDEMKEFTSINVDEYLNIYNGEEKTLVLVARPTCQYCQIAEPILHNIAYKYNLNINYLNTDEFQEEDSSKFIGSNSFFSSGFGTPMLLIVSNGKINDIFDGVTDTKHYIEFLKTNSFIK